MPYFTQFQKESYPLSDDVVKNLTNISHYTAIFSRLADDASFYTYYNAGGDERLDTISYNLYGTTDYYWTIPILNADIINTWRNSIKSEASFNKYLEQKYPGVALIIDPVDDIVGKFDVGEIVAYDITNVYRVLNKYPSLRYIHCEKLLLEDIPDNITPTEVNVESVILAYKAPAYYLDLDGNRVPWYKGTTPVTFEEVEREKNEGYGRIKVIRPEFIYDVAAQFEREMA